MSRLFSLSVLELHRLLVRREVTATELTQVSFARLAETEPKIEAFLALNEEQAYHHAAAIDQKGVQKEEVLAGIPMALKDNMLTKGLTTTAASRILENFVPPFDATLVEKLRKAKMILIGKTNMDEFAMGGSTETSYFQKTKNAWNLSKVPGGSSGGSAAAVAAGVVPVAFGSDTGGSIRQPSSFNGIVGFKPTYGRVSRFGLIALGSTFDQIGPMTRSVHDNALVLNAIAGHDPKDSTSSPKKVPDFTAKIGHEIKGLKIGVPKEYIGAGVQPEVVAAVKNAMKTFESLGAHVEEVSLPHVKLGVPIYYVLSCAEGMSNMQGLDGLRYGFQAQAETLEEMYTQTRSQGFGEEVKRRVMLGTYSLIAKNYESYFEQAMKIRTLIIQEFKQAFQTVDLMMGPTAPTVAYGLNEHFTDPVTMYMGDELTIPLNIAGLPGMSIPCGFHEGLPIGLQLIGNYFDEATMYQVGHAFETATDFHTKIAPMIGGGSNG